LRILVAFLVEFSADFSMLRPRNGNGTALVEISNRGANDIAGFGIAKDRQGAVLSQMPRL
jgi:hypothetical protein